MPFQSFTLYALFVGSGIFVNIGRTLVMPVKVEEEEDDDDDDDEDVGDNDDNGNDDDYI